LTILLLTLLSHLALGQLIEPDEGVANGTVAAKEADFLFLKTANDIPRRYYIRPGDTTNREKIGGLPVGQTVEIHWTRDDRRRIDSIRTAGDAGSVSPPAEGTARAVSGTESAVAERSPVATAESIGSSTLGERVNAGLDNLLAFGNRVAELPLWMPLLVVLLAVGAGFGIAGRFERTGRPAAARRLRLLGGAMAVLLVAYCMDRKINRLQSELNTLRTRLTPVAFSPLPTTGITPALATTQPAAATAPTARPFLFDTASAKTSLEGQFKDVSLRPSVCDPASDVVQIHFGQPQIAAFLAVVDLGNPAVRVRLGANLQNKTLTSDFARETGCTIAINGEAGQSPAMNSGFGSWRGWMVADGKTVLAEQPGNPRPFLAFDAKGAATYRPMAASDRTLPASVPNVIWGRLDALINGVVQTGDERYRQPRTAMGISADGTRLFLLVADGRQNGYSIGLTREEVGHVLKAFGAANGMLCDEGGSSCLYVKRAGGIVNLPSDNGGEERPTYTHFGVSVRG
jgi:hypothetical protein